MILDLGLADISGFDLLSKIRKEPSPSPNSRLSSTPAKR